MKELQTATGRRVILAGHYDDTNGTRIAFRENVNVMQMNIPARGALKARVVDGYFMVAGGYSYPMVIEPVSIENLTNTFSTDVEHVLYSDWDTPAGRIETSREDMQWEAVVDSEEELREWLANN